jgi:hypothetical protein
MLTTPSYNSEYAAPLRSAQIALRATSRIRETLYELVSYLY